MPNLPGPAVASSWLRRVRWAFVAAELAFLALSRVGLLDPLPVAPIAATLGVVLAADLGEALAARRWPASSSRRVAAHLALDLLALSVLVASSPDAHQPMQVFFVVEPAVAATVLRPATSALAAVAAAALLALAGVAAGAVRGDPELPHLASHAALLGFATLTTTWFVARLADALRRSEETRAATDRLAALGTLAAGVAHEIATPLGTVGVLADELALSDLAPPERERSRAALHAQLVRCRDLLRRLKTGPGELAGTTDRLAERVAEWAADWHRAHAPDAAPPRVEVAAGVGAVRGREEAWRGAVWTLLSNARRAGADRIEVRVVPAGPASAPHVVLNVDDDGCGVSTEVAARAGEPFFTAWSGQGLGLFAARTFARAVGGDLALEARPGTGARAVLRMPAEP